MTKHNQLAAEFKAKEVLELIGGQKTAAERC